MAGLEYHIGRRGWPGFTVPVTVTDGTNTNVQREVVPAVTLVDTSGNAIGGSAATSPTYSQIVNAKGQAAGLATYSALGKAYAGYTTPTDMLVISGSASKTILVTQFLLQIAETTATLRTVDFIKRTTANTGGTATNPSAIAYDSTNPAASAVISLYSAAPSLGSTTNGGIIFSATAVTSTATAAGGAFGINTPSAAVRSIPTSPTDFRQSITLRGTGESLAANFGGAALPAGFTANWLIEWVEY